MYHPANNDTYEGAHTIILKNAPSAARTPSFQFRTMTESSLGERLTTSQGYHETEVRLGRKSHPTNLGRTTDDLGQSVRSGARRV